jgi:hypothetical protein
MLRLTLSVAPLSGNELWGMSYPDPYLQLYNSSALALKAARCVSVDLRQPGLGLCPSS